MPDQRPQKQEQQVIPEFRSHSRRDLIIVAVIMAIEALIFIIIFSKPKGVEETGGTSQPGITSFTQHQEDELLAPQIDIPNVIASIKVDDAGSRLHTLSMGITIKTGKRVTGKPEEQIDLKYLETVYKPKIEMLIPAIKDALIRQVSARTYSELLQSSVRQQILDNLKKTANEMLEAYGIEPGIVDIYWTLWLFS